MDKCTFCDADTELYVSGVPVCVACAEDAERRDRVLTARRLHSTDSRVKEKTKEATAPLTTHTSCSLI